MKILVVIPAYNEEKIIKLNLIILDSFLRSNLKNDQYLIVVADNNSTDATGEIIKKLETQYASIKYLYLPQKGKGLAIRTAWQKYRDEFDLFGFMDADLATDLTAFPALIEGIKQGNDLVIASRYLPQSQTNRSLLRRFFSFGYRLVLKIIFGTKIKDFPCGFKMVSQAVVKNIVPKIESNQWFFDSELLYLAEKAGYKIKEIPVNWREPRTKETRGTISLRKQSIEYLKAVIKLRLRQ